MLVGGGVECSVGFSLRSVAGLEEGAGRKFFAQLRVAPGFRWKIRGERAGWAYGSFAEGSLRKITSSRPPLP